MEQEMKRNSNVVQVDLLIYSSDEELHNHIAAVSKTEFLIRYASSPEKLNETLEQFKDTTGVIIIDSLTMDADELQEVVTVIKKAPMLIGIIFTEDGKRNELLKTVTIPIQHSVLKRNSSENVVRTIIQTSAKKHLALRLKEQAKDESPSLNKAEVDTGAAEVVNDVAQENGSDSGQLGSIQTNVKIDIEEPTDYIKKQANATASQPGKIVLDENSALQAGISRLLGKKEINKSTVVSVISVLVISIGIYFFVTSDIGDERKNKLAAENTAEMNAITKAETQLNNLLANADASVEADKYFEPEQDNALYYLSQAQEIGPDRPAVRQAINKFIGEILQDVEANLAIHQLSAAFNMINKVRGLQPEDPRFSDFDKQLKEQITATLVNAKTVAEQGDIDQAKNMLSEVSSVLSIDLDILMSLQTDHLLWQILYN